MANATPLILCDLCKKPLDPIKGGHWDHDHSCGKTACKKCTRGYVHPGCNGMIGAYENGHRGSLTVGEEVEGVFVPSYHGWTTVEEKNAAIAAYLQEATLSRGLA